MNGVPRWRRLSIVPWWMMLTLKPCERFKKCRLALEFNTDWLTLSVSARLGFNFPQVSPSTLSIPLQGRDNYLEHLWDCFIIYLRCHLFTHSVTHSLAIQIWLSLPCHARKPICKIIRVPTTNSGAVIVAHFLMPMHRICNICINF